MNQSIFCLEKFLHFRYLIGIVITSLCWKSNEWVGLSLVCAIPDVLKTVERICKIDKMYEDKIIASKLTVYGLVSIDLDLVAIQ